MSNTSQTVVNSNMIKPYIELTKPGIIWGNCIAMTGGFMLASQGKPDFLLYCVTLLGIALIIASGCVFNNVIDADIDELMDRTNQRSLVVGLVSKKYALIYASVLGIAGFSVLFTINFATLLLGMFGFYFYVIMYSLMYKRTSVHSTIIGSASGATPPVIGYLAVTGQFDLASILIFFGFCAWQVPHTYAIALFRKQDYQNCNIPLFPLVKSLQSTQRSMLAYILLFFASIVALFIYQYISVLTLVVMTAICSYWGYQDIILFKPNDENFSTRQWGKKLFITSIIAVTVFSVVISIDYVFR